jgi:hypothetical protein
VRGVGASATPSTRKRNRVERRPHLRCSSGARAARSCGETAASAMRAGAAGARSTPRHRDTSPGGSHGTSGAGTAATCLSDSRLARDLDRCCAPRVQAGEKLTERAKLDSAPGEVLGAGHILHHEHKGTPLTARSRVRSRGFPRCRGGGSGAGWTRVPFPAPPPPQAAPVRSRLCRLQGASEPTAPSAGPCFVHLWRPRDLVDGGRADGRRRAGCFRTTSPSAPPQRGSARSRSHDREPSP